MSFTRLASSVSWPRAYSPRAASSMVERHRDCRQLRGTLPAARQHRPRSLPGSDNLASRPRRSSRGAWRCLLRSVFIPIAVQTKPLSKTRQTSNDNSLGLCLMASSLANLHTKGCIPRLIDGLECHQQRSVLPSRGFWAVELLRT